MENIIILHWLMQFQRAVLGSHGESIGRLSLLILWDEAAKTASNPPALAFFEVRSEW